jgi:imidazolonepropionase-like amidohydrolase
VRNGIITYVGRRVRSLPADTKRIDLSGQTILPGLVMMHEHINYFSGAYIWDAQPGSVPKLLLGAGVTTARTAGAEAPQIDLNLKQRIDQGRAVGPRLFITGPYLNDPEDAFLGDNPVRTADEARAVTAYWGSRGATSVKVYSAISPDALRGAVDEANRRGMHVAGHLGDISCSEAATNGIHTIEHGLTSCMKDFGITPATIALFRYNASKTVAHRLIALLVKRGVVIVSTPPATDAYNPSAEELSMLSPDQLARYRKQVKERPPWLPPLAAMPEWDRAHRAFERDFVRAGGRLLVGADASDGGIVPGYANHNAIIALVKAGFTPLQVLKFSTADAAEYLKVGSRIGTIAPGRTADLLIVKGAPDRRIEDIRNVTYVFKDGRAYDPAKLRASAKGLLGQH